MAYLTRKQLSSTIDIPVSLPAVELLQGDWLVITNVKLIAPMRLTYQFLTAQMVSASVDTRNVTADNKISANLGLAFCGLYFNYSSGHPGQTGQNSPAYGVVTLDGLQTVARTSPPIIHTTPGVYSIVVANNMKPDASSSDSPPIDRATSIDFKLVVSGSLRLELHPV